MGTIGELWTAYRQRWRRRRLLLRAFRMRQQLTPVADRTSDIRPGDILAFSTVRNEAARLPFFLDHYRRLGVGHFLFVDNGSDDGTRELLEAQGDVSLWSTGESYKLSRFGVDWLTWLQFRYGHGHWCLTADADEILIYPHWETRPLPALTKWLDAAGHRAFGALLLDMVPRGRLDEVTYKPGDDPFEILSWFDGDNYTFQPRARLQDCWIQGGVRAREFFAADRRRAPTLNKVPLVKWNRRYAYLNSTHTLLPRRLNRVFDAAGGSLATGVLLHTKFLHMAVEKSREEKRRREHFAISEIYDDYYDALIANPVLWNENSVRYSDWRQLAALGLMSQGEWG